MPAICIFPARQKTPKYMEYLGRNLPYATIGLLVVYCLKGSSFTNYPFVLPELITVVVIAVLHGMKHNSLLSIGTGTVLYMLLIQVVFK